MTWGSDINALAGIMEAAQLSSTDARAMAERAVREFYREALSDYLASLNGIQKYGRNPSIASAVSITAPEDIWNGGDEYTGFNPTVARTLLVASGNAADTAAGTGLQAVRLFGLNALWRPIWEDVELAGTSDVETVQEFIRMNRVKGMRAGSGRRSAGAVTVRQSAGDEDVMAVVPAGYSRSQICATSIPDGVLGVVDRLKLGAYNGQTSAAEAEVGMATREFSTGCWEQQRPLHVSTAGPTRDESDHHPLLILPPKTDAVARCTDNSSNQAIGVVARFEVRLIPVAA